jgi:imidazolonepropionase
MPVLSNIGLLATCAAGGGQGDVHPIPRAALAWEEETIRWVGPERDLPAELRGAERWDAGGRLVVPGLVDCHTHLCFGGWRADEFALRLSGATYLEIARQGGGIASTVARTRALSPDELFARAAGFLEEMQRLGVTTAEAKSGYGLDVETELRLLRVHRRLDRETPMRVVSTYLGAHALPAEYRDRRGDYLALVAEEMVPRVALERLADGVDAYVDEGAFTIAEGRRVLAAARASGLPVRLHADQLACTGGAELAAEMGALSADHLESVSDRGIAALAASGAVAVTLPIAALYLGVPPAPARKLIEAGVPVAVATDFNPGTSPSYHLPLALTLACTLQRMTPAEALKGATLHAARALGLAGAVGSLEPGKAADLAVIDAESPEEWLYHFRANACRLTVAAGRVAWRAPEE